MKKPKNLTLKEMWEIYILSDSPTGLTVKKSLEIMYPGKSTNRLSTDEGFSTYLYGLTWNGFSVFSTFIDLLIKRDNGIRQ